MLRAGQRCQVKLSRPHVEISPPPSPVFFKCAIHLGLGLGDRACSSVVEQPAHNRLVRSQPDPLPYLIPSSFLGERGCPEGDHLGFAARPHDRAGLRQGEVCGVHRPDVRAEVRGALGHFAPVKVNDILTLDFDDSETLAPITTPSWPRTRSYTRSCSGSRTRGALSGAGRARGRTGRSTTCTRGAASTSSARTGMCGRLSRTLMLRSDGYYGVTGVGVFARRWVVGEAAVPEESGGCLSGARSRGV